MAVLAKFGSVVLVVAALAGVQSPMQAAPVASGVCQPTTSKFKASEESTTVTTTSSSYVPVNGTLINFVQGSGSSCIVVSFTADARSEFPGVLADVAIYVDGKVCRRSTLMTSPLDFVTTTVKAVCADVAAGSHSVQIKYRRTDADGFVKLQNFTTIVEHRQ